jgi:molybdenum cofactor cytidylyltransferase
MGAVSAILIAAGESTRMGQPKPLLRWHGAPLVQYQTSSLVQAGVAEVVVVLGDRHELVARYVKGPGVRISVNPDFQLGKSTSIRAGLRATDPASSDILLLAVDQPRPPEIIAAVVDAHRRANALITAPRHRGGGGHPVVFSAVLRPELERITEEGQGVRQVFRAHRSEVNEVEMDDAIILLDLNDPEAYEEARARYGA